MTPEASVADRFDVFLLDLDGVIQVGEEPLPDAVESVGRLRAMGKQLRFLTNDPRPRRRTIAGRLRDLGIDVEVDEIVTSGWATARHLREAGITAVSTVGSEGLRAELRAGGLELTEEDPDAVVVGADEHTCYRDIQRAARHIHRGARFVGTNPDGSFPTPEGPAPGAGAVVRAVEAAAGTEPTVVGKPEPLMFELALEDQPEEARAVVVGDNADTDVLGAHRAGLTGVLVADDEPAYSTGADFRRPDATISTLADLFARPDRTPTSEGGVDSSILFDQCQANNSLTEVKEMDDEAVEQVRRFNRTVTQRIGALNDRFMSRDRPLGEARVLWEIGDAGGTTVRSLRKRLELDAGYMSRLLRSLEEDGMAVVEPDPTDGRVRVARLTDAGLEERAILDRLSDDLARSFLSPLNESQQARLVEAMGVVERLLTAGLVKVQVADPASADARYCLDAYFEELDDRFEDGFDPARSISADAEELTAPDGLLLLARLYGEPIGCGALKFHNHQPAELKRMWVDPSARGLGLGRRLLAELEEQARQHDVTTIRLETNRTLTEAIELYRSAGYEEVVPFNDEPYADHWFEKRLPPDPTGDP